MRPHSPEAIQSAMVDAVARIDDARQSDRSLQTRSAREDAIIDGLMLLAEMCGTELRRPSGIDISSGEVTVNCITDSNGSSISGYGETFAGFLNQIPVRRSSDITPNKGLEMANLVDQIPARRRGGGYTLPSKGHVTDQDSCVHIKDYDLLKMLRCAANGNDMDFKKSSYQKIDKPEEKTLQPRSPVDVKPENEHSFNQEAAERHNLLHKLKKGCTVVLRGPANEDTRNTLKKVGVAAVVAVTLVSALSVAKPHIEESVANSNQVTFPSAMESVDALSRSPGNPFGVGEMDPHAVAGILSSSQMEDKNDADLDRSQNPEF